MNVENDFVGTCIFRPVTDGRTLVVGNVGTVWERVRSDNSHAHESLGVHL